MCYLPIVQRSLTSIPLTLEQAFSNLIYIAVLYGEYVQTRLGAWANLTVVEVRDFGPGAEATDNPLMAQAYAYFDESGTDEKSPDLVVAGYIFLSENVAPFEAEWKEMLEKFGLPFFHAVECMHGKGVFKHLTREERTAAQIEAIEIIKRYGAKGIALSIDKAVFPAIGHPPLWTTPYTFLCGQVLFGVRDWANATGFHGEVEYVYEAGADGQSKAAKETAHALLNEESRLVFRYGKHRHATKTEDMGLQAADLLAWHWYTHNRHIKEGKGKRKDFQNLMGLPVDFHHYAEPPVKHWNSVVPIIKPAMLWLKNWHPPTHSSLYTLFGSINSKGNPVE